MMENVKALQLEQKFSILHSANVETANALNITSNVESSQSSSSSGYSTDEALRDFFIPCWQPKPKRVRKSVDYYSDNYKTVSVFDQTNLEKNVFTDWTKALCDAGNC
jgi:hypothetical protein